MTLALFMGIGVGILGFLLARPLLEWMDSPPDVIDGATLYVRIYFLGMPANMLYNFGAATLRAVGDTRRPLYYLMISGLVNVALNLVLVVVFKMAVAGVAIATVISQVVSMVLVLLCLLRSSGAMKLEIRECRIDRYSALQMVRVGLPAGLQGSLFSISNVLIQSSVNSFGSLVVAGNGVASNIEGFVYTAMNAQHQACMTFASQNYGAGKYRPGAEDPVVLPGHRGGVRPGPGPAGLCLRRAADEPVQQRSGRHCLRHDPDEHHPAHLFPLRHDGRDGGPAAGHRLFHHAHDRFPDRRLPAAHRLDHDRVRGGSHPECAVYLLPHLLGRDLRDPPGSAT